MPDSPDDAISDTAPNNTVLSETALSEAPSRRASAGPHRSRASAEAILDAAQALLEEAGYAGFSIEQVAKRAGAGKPTIYRWWSGKAALLLDVYSRQKLVLNDSDTGTLEGDLVALIRGLWRFWRETSAGGAFRSIIAEAQSDPAAQQALRRFMAERRYHVVDIFERAAARGELQPEVDMETALDIVTGYIWVRTLTGRIDDEPEAIEIAVRQMTRGTARR